MTLKRNLLANYASQIYVTIIGIVMVPLYMKHMGAEAYGLVGFFAMLQSCFNLLDMGLTPTMARETARYNGGAMDALSYRQMARVLEVIFAGVAVIGGGVLLLSSGYIAQHWLNADQLPLAEITIALKLVAVIVALRWTCGFYRGVISGYERLVWLSVFNAAIATLRFILVLPLLVFVSAKPSAFFGFQLCVAVLELVGLALYSYRLVPSIGEGQRIGLQWLQLKPLIKFSLSIAFTTSVWVLVTQSDKLVLSKILSLADYGYFTVAVLVATGVSVMTGPISGAILPRMSRLQAEGAETQLFDLYRQATQLMMVVALPVALVLAFFSEQVLWAWTGNLLLVKKTAPVLSLYALGYGILSAGAFPYYLQYAKGDLRLHLIGNALFVLLLIPSVIWAAVHHGMLGAGWAWLGANVLYFVLWVPKVHKRFKLELHSVWLKKDIAKPLSFPIIFTFLVSSSFAWTGDRTLLFFELVGMLLILMFLTFLNASLIKIAQW